MKTQVALQWWNTVVDKLTLAYRYGYADYNIKTNDIHRIYKLEKKYRRI